MKFRDNDGKFKDLFVKTADTLPIGAMLPYGNAKAPVNWLVCDGSEISRTEYAELFAVIGTSYGEGDGSTTFNLPDKRGKQSIGLDTADEAFNTIGNTGGEKEHTLAHDEMPLHSHRLTSAINNPSSSYNAIVGVKGYASDAAETPQTTTTAGNGQPHNVLDPYEVDQWIIKAAQSIGVVGNIVNQETESNKDTYSCDYINDKFDYSTEEQIIGTWIDGKPLYRKVVTGTVLKHGTWNQTIILQDNNIDNIISVKGMVGYNNGKHQIGAYANTNFYSLLQYNYDEHALYFYGADNYVDYLATVIIEYTKTTDEVTE